MEVEIRVRVGESYATFKRETDELTNGTGQLMNGPQAWDLLDHLYQDARTWIGSSLQGSGPARNVRPIKDNPQA